jgi:hypothetical protein
MKKVIFLAALLGLLLSCSREDIGGFEPTLPIGDVEYFIFGISSGECIADCFQFYKLTNGGLFALKKYKQRTKQTKFVYEKESLLDTEVTKARGLLQLFPPELLSQPERMGCPGCNDAPAIFVEVKQRGNIQTWNMEGDPKSHPAYLSPFTKTLMDLVYELEK